MTGTVFAKNLVDDYEKSGKHGQKHEDKREKREEKGEKNAEKRQREDAKQNAYFDDQYSTFPIYTTPRLTGTTNVAFLA